MAELSLPWALACSSAFPLILVAALERRPDVWQTVATYSKPNEYGEPKVWRSALRTPWNAYSSLAYYYAGVYALHDIVVVRAQRPPQNCVDVHPHWNVAVGVASCWVGLASFMFHASLTERWRVLDAGATMGVSVFGAPLAVYKWLRSSWHFDAPLLQPLTFAFTLLAFAGCHLLARTPGWSDFVLIPALVGAILIECTALATTKTRDDMLVWALYLAIMLTGVVLRAADVAVAKQADKHAKKQDAPPIVWNGSTMLVGCPQCGPVHGPFRHRAWLGHTVWHLLTGAAIAILVGGSRFVREPFCLDSPTE